jgi:5-methylcytosine-specific restriction protein A
MGRITNLASTLSSLAPRLRPPPKIAESFYLSAAWRGLMARLKAERGNVCQKCGARGRVLGDHIIERKDGGNDLDPGNVMLMCWGCHNAKTAKAKARRVGR